MIRHAPAALFAPAALLAVLATTLPAAAQDAVTADTVVATVDGTDITLGHVVAMRARLPEQYQQLDDATLLEGMIQQLIQQEALAADRAAEDLRLDALSLENERRAYLAGRAIDAVAEGAVTEEAVQAAYDEIVAEFEPQTEYSAAHILVETEEAAQALVERLAAGEDFAELAMAESTGPSGPRGGDLGWFAAGQMVQPFQDAVETLEPGAVSAPVQTQFGWHVIKLNETRETAAPPLEQIYPQVEQRVQEAAVAAALEAATEGAEVVRAEIDLDPAIIRQDDLLE